MPNLRAASQVIAGVDDQLLVAADAVLQPRGFPDPAQTDPFDLQPVVASTIATCGPSTRICTVLVGMVADSCPATLS